MSEDTLQAEATMDELADEQLSDEQLDELAFAIVDPKHGSSS